MLKVWIAGANGQIGRALNDMLDPMEIEALNTDIDELDITDCCGAAAFPARRRSRWAWRRCGTANTAAALHARLWLSSMGLEGMKH